MIWLISDPHGSEAISGLNKYVSLCTKDDWLLILGDVELGFPKFKDTSGFTEYFESLPCNIAFLDGNHENFDYLYSFPEEDWHGGRVHRISPNIVHLMRGYVFELEGKTFFTMGGCRSTKKWKDKNLWWPQEDPTEEEITRAYHSLSAHNNRIDFVLTHKYPLKPMPEVQSPMLEDLYRYIDEQVTFCHWYSGHWHRFAVVDKKHTVIYDKLVEL